MHRSSKANPTRHRAASAIGLGIAVAAIALMVPGAEATPVPGSSSGAVDPGAGTVITTPSGSRVTLSKQFSAYTIADLTAIGLGPGQHPAGTSASAVSATPHAAIPQTIKPDSATGTNQDVTIFLSGRGLKLNSWTTSLNDSFGGGYTYAVYWRPSNVIWATSGVIYVAPDSWALSYVTPTPIRFSGKTKVCNSWVHYAGKPCETVHR